MTRTYTSENNIALNTNELQQLNRFSHDRAFSLGYEPGSIEFCNKVSEIFDAELDLANQKYQSLKTQVATMDND